jgi:hypothetical protein
MSRVMIRGATEASAKRIKEGELASGLREANFFVLTDEGFPR